MKQLGLLLIAVCGNAFGLALMLETDLGASVWGSAVSNISAFFSITEGVSMIVMSLVFYAIAVLIQQTVSLLDAAMSIAFLVTYGTLLNGFIYLIPNLSELSVIILILLNVVGMLILLFSISLHLHVNRAVHPLDVYMRALQRAFKNVGIGTYVTYGSAFLVAIVFGLLHGTISDIGIGTVMVILFGGAIMEVYDRLLFAKGREEANVPD